MSWEGRWGCRAHRGASRLSPSLPYSHTPRGVPVRPPPSPPTVPRRAPAPSLSAAQGHARAGKGSVAAADSSLLVPSSSNIRRHRVPITSRGSRAYTKRCGERTLTISRGGHRRQHAGMRLPPLQKLGSLDCAGPHLASSEWSHDGAALYKLRAQQQYHSSGAFVYNTSGRCWQGAANTAVYILILSSQAGTVTQESVLATAYRWSTLTQAPMPWSTTTSTLVNYPSHTRGAGGATSRTSSRR